MNNFALGIFCKVDQKNYSEDKVYPLIGTIFDNGQLRLLFADDYNTIWWVDHSKVKVADERYKSRPEKPVPPLVPETTVTAQSKTPTKTKTVNE